MLIQSIGKYSLLFTDTDNQGSLIALTYDSGAVVEKYAYDPWGARRDPANWQLKDTRTSFITNRGYTGHEHMDAFGIINLNGRVYDPLTAMFFSPDPFIQEPGNWLNYNRYGYCMNNPTGYIDPSGYQAIKQTENGNSSMWYAFQQMAQTESRLGISDGGISFGSGFTGYSYSDAYVEARSKGFKGTYSDFITISLTQMTRASFNGKVVVHTWGPSSTSVNSKKLNTINISLGNGKNSSLAGNLTNGIGVGLGAISLSVGRAIENELAYLNTTSLIKPTQTLLKVGPANLLVSNTLSKSLTRAGVGLSIVSAAITFNDAYEKGEWKNHHTADLIVNGTLTTLSVFCPLAGFALGGIYFVGDITSQYYYHKSLTEKLFDE